MAKSLSNYSITQEHFKNVHNALLKKYANAKDTKAGYAKEIETFLNLVKSPDRADSNYYIWKSLHDKVAQLAKVKRKDLFKQSFSKSADTGVAFEKEMSLLLDTMVNYAWDDTRKKLYAKKGTGTRRVAGRVNTGMIQGTVYADDISFGDLLKFNPKQEKFLKAITEKTKEENHKYKDLVHAQLKDIKTDIKGDELSSFTADIDWATTDLWEKYAKLLTSFSFSVKSYSSLKSSWYGIDLGDTNPYKAYMGVLSTLGYSASEIYESYRRAYWCNYYTTVKTARDHSEHGAALHMTHIQNIYELIGAGLASGIGKDNVDFLIINDTGSNNIYVQSTDQLIYEILTNNSRFRSTTKNPFVYNKISVSGARVKN